MSVYKPLVLGLAASTFGGEFTLTVANQDGSPFEAERIPNLQIYSTPGLPAAGLSWNLETNTGALSNGILRIDFLEEGSPYRFWRAMEQ